MLDAQIGSTKILFVRSGPERISLIYLTSFMICACRPTLAKDLKLGLVNVAASGVAIVADKFLQEAPKSEE